MRGQGSPNWERGLVDYLRVPELAKLGGGVPKIEWWAGLPRARRRGPIRGVVSCERAGLRRLGKSFAARGGVLSGAGLTRGGA